MPAFLRELFAPDGPVPIRPGQAGVVVAAPTPTDGDTQAGQALHTLLAEDTGFARVRLVPGLQCVAAAYLETRQPDAGCLLLCDVGASTVDAAVCAAEGTTTRLLDSEHGDIASSGLRSALLIAADSHGSTNDPARIVALEDERYRSSRRARVVLQRALMQDRYLDTPAYLPGAHGGAITAEAVLSALRPVAETTARVVYRLLARIIDPLLPEVVVTGGNALDPVLRAVLDAADGRVRSTRLLDPAAAARGALLIATGQATALDGYPHELGIAAHRVRQGLLESVIIPLTTDAPPVVTVQHDHCAPLPVVIKPHGRGPWLHLEAAEPVSVPQGRYRVGVCRRRGGLGAVSLRPPEGGPDIVCALGSRAGPAVASTDASTGSRGAAGDR